MEPVLKREEIEDLLQAIRSGEITPETLAPGEFQQSQKFLNAAEIDLFATYEHAEHGGGKVDIPNLDIILDRFGNNVANTLSNTLQRAFYGEREEMKSLEFRQSIDELNNAGTIAIYDIDPLKHGCLLHISTQLAFTLLELMLGSSGGGQPSAENRKLTVIELNILKPILEDICKDLQKAFAQVTAVYPRLTKLENNFRLVEIVHSEDKVIVTTMNINTARGIAGQLRLIMPVLGLAPLREQFSGLSKAVVEEDTWETILAEQAQKLPCTITARSGLISMNIEQILRMQVGDILDLPYNPDKPITILAEDVPKYYAQPGEQNGKKAFYITSRHTS